jgi:hypothetical protein
MSESLLNAMKYFATYLANYNRATILFKDNL